MKTFLAIAVVATITSIIGFFIGDGSANVAVLFQLWIAMRLRRATVADVRSARLLFLAGLVVAPLLIPLALLGGRISIAVVAVTLGGYMALAMWGLQVLRSPTIELCTFCSAYDRSGCKVRADPRCVSCGC